jgi:hypothetical protein
MTAVFAGLVLASSAKAAVVTYTLSLHESVTGQVTTANQFVLYATVSQGDNAGLFAYGVDLKAPGEPGGPTTMTIVNRTPTGTWVIDDTDANYDGGVYNDKVGGFGTGRGASAVTGIVSGVQDLAKGDDLIRVYGFGQTPHKMNDFKPPPVEGSLGPIAYSNYVAATGTDGGASAYGVPFNPPGSPQLPLGTVRIATGTWTGGTGGGCGGSLNVPSIDVSSVNTKASVWKLDHPNGTENEIATLQFAVRDYLIVDCFDHVALNGPLSGTNQAVGGFISVSGANGSYVSEVDQLLEPSMSTGNAPIQTIGDEQGNIYVMAKLTGTAADIAAVLGTMNEDVDATDPQFARLHQLYDAQFSAGGFNALFKFPNVAGAKAFNWALAGGSHGPVAVDQLAVVPEPAMALLAMSAAVMLRRRRVR